MADNEPTGWMTPERLEEIRELAADVAREATETDPEELARIAVPALVSALESAWAERDHAAAQLVGMECGVNGLRREAEEDRAAIKALVTAIQEIRRREGLTRSGDMMDKVDGLIEQLERREVV